MTQNDPNRLDRIEALLERSIVESDQRHREADERLTRIEAIVQTNAQIIQSNARSIEAMGTQFEDTKRLADRVFQRIDSLTQQLASSVSDRNEERTQLNSMKRVLNRIAKAMGIASED